MSAEPPGPRRPDGAADASMRAARLVVAAMVTHGVRHAVLCPGSRSAPLAYALAAAEDRGELHLRVVLDERSAGFVALGISKAHLLAGRRQPAVVVTTSGTAVANLHPAVLEADASGVPLLVLSADRPHELVGTGANQTTEQTALFGRAPRAVIDLPADITADLPLRQAAAALDGRVRHAVLAATGELSRDPGPAHINIRFRPPLAPQGVNDRPDISAQAPREPGGPARARGPADASAPPPDPPAAQSAPAGEDGRAQTRVLPAAEGGQTACARQASTATAQDCAGLVVAGDAPDPAVGHLARTLAEHLGWPLLAEPSSGARAGYHALTRYAELLTTPAGQELAARVRRIVVLGHPSLTRSVSALLSRTGPRLDVLADRARYTDVAGTAARVHPIDGVDGAPAIARALGATAAAPGWLSAWRAAVAALPQASGQEWGPDAAALAVWQAACQPHSPRLVLGSSMTIRRFDRLAVPVARAPVVVANRGLAGIDGTLATATGLALGTGEPVRAVVGDLTFLHDAMSLGRGRHEVPVDLQVVVLNDGGGGIFRELEYAAVPGRERFTRLFTTPQVTAIPELARSLGARVQEPGDVDTLRELLAAPVRGLSVVHVSAGSWS